MVVSRDVGRAAAEAFLGRELDGDVEANLPGRFDEIGDDVFAGAHNPAGAEWLVERLPRATTWSSPRSSPTRTPRRCWPRSPAPATRSSPPSRAARGRCLPTSWRPAHEPFFERVESVSDPVAALERGRDLAGEQGAVLVTGSLYLLADLTVRLQRVPWGSSASA